MNLNDYADDLNREEQMKLDALVSEMDQVIDGLDEKMQEYIREAKNADISLNLDQYCAHVLAKKGIADTSENRKKLLKARDELYTNRLLLECEDSLGKGIVEYKVGLHSCIHECEEYVISWTMPICRHYLLDNSSVEYENITIGKFGQEFHAKYKLLVRNKVDLWFTRVKNVLNLYPNSINEEMLREIKEGHFFSDEFIDKLIDQFNPDDFDPYGAAKVIADEFLQELLERRSTSEFKNIVFSIQKKQAEIIQAPYKRHMIVQGCAGSGKSMILMHRLPILIYDNPTNKVRKLWEGIIDLCEVKDVFTGDAVVPKQYEVDHFIPWSFVMNDELWNLMPMDSSLNSVKSNRLPKWDPFFTRFAENQFLLYGYIHSKSGIRKLYEACFRDNLHSIWAWQELYRKGNTQEEFYNILEKNMQPVYESARRQGYEIWNKSV